MPQAPKVGKNKPRKSAGKVAWTVTQAVLLIVILAVAVPLLAYKQPAIVGQDHAYVVLSGSMVPHMDPGDIIFVNEVDASAVELGDVITFRSESESDTLFTHRVVEVLRQNGEPAWKTKGDANDDIDEGFVTPDRLVGRQDYLMPKIGHVDQFASSRTGFFLFIAGPTLILIGTHLVRLYKELDAADKRRQERKAQKAAAAQASRDHPTPKAPSGPKPAQPKQRIAGQVGPARPRGPARRVPVPESGTR